MTPNFATELETLMTSWNYRMISINLLSGRTSGPLLRHFNVDKCSVMRIGYNNMKSNYNMSNQQLPTTDQQRDLGIITKDLKWQKQT